MARTYAPTPEASQRPTPRQFDGHSGWPSRHGNSHLGHRFPGGDSE